MSSQRTYTPKEVAEIFRKVTLHATKRPIGASFQEDSISGLSADEIISAGMEAGLNPDSIRSAMLEIDKPGGLIHQGDVIFNGPEIYMDMVIRGPISPETAEDLLESLSETRGDFRCSLQGLPGHGTGTHSSHIGKKLTEWKFIGLGGQLQTRVSFRKGEDQTLVRVSLTNLVGGNWKNMPNMNAVIGIGAAFVAGAISLTTTGSFIFAGVLTAMSYGLGVLGCMYYYRKSSSKYREELRRLADAVVIFLGENMEFPISQVSEETQSPSHSIEFPDAENDPSNPASHNRLRHS